MAELRAPERICLSQPAVRSTRPRPKWKGTANETAVAVRGKTLCRPVAQSVAMCLAFEGRASIDAD